MQFAWIVWEIGGDLFADESARPITDLQTTFNGVVVGNGDVVHSPCQQRLIELPRVGIAVGEIETAKEPFFRAGTVARMNMKIAPAHIYIPRVSLCCAIQSW